MLTLQFFCKASKDNNTERNSVAILTFIYVSKFSNLIIAKDINMKCYYLEISVLKFAAKQSCTSLQSSAVR